MAEVSFSDWEKLDIRVGKIEKVEDVEGTDKLYKLTINIGDEKRIACAALKPYYKKQGLKGKKCIFFVNLTPRTIKGIESQGMILAADQSEKGKVILITPEKDIEVGSKIR